MRRTDRLTGAREGGGGGETVTEYAESVHGYGAEVLLAEEPVGFGC